jgi:hypothetical protein
MLVLLAGKVGRLIVSCQLYSSITEVHETSPQISRMVNQAAGPPANLR